MTTNPIAYVFWLPFYVVKGLVLGYTLVPFPYGLLVLGIVLVGLVVASLTEAGPLRVAAIFRRFSWLGIPLGAFALWWTYCALLFLYDPMMDGWAVVNSGMLLLGFLSVGWFIEYVVMRGHLGRGIWIRALRRVRFRLRWDSIAKSAGMAHERDVRPHNWSTGGTTVIRQRALSVQWTPTLWHGRRGADDTTQYLIRPARGLSARHWTQPDDMGEVEVQRAIAIAAKAHSCNISPSKLKNWWILTVFWNSPSEYRPELEYE